MSCSPDPKAVKMKQLRLPFAPVNKFEVSSSSSPCKTDPVAPSSSSTPSISSISSASSELSVKKRKVPSSPHLPESKIFRPSCSSPRSSRSSSLLLRPSSPQVVVSVVTEGMHPIAELQVETPSLKEKKRDIRVEMGRLTLLLIEEKDAMEAAVSKQDFLQAQKHKLQLESLAARKEDLQNKLLLHGNDSKSLESILKDIGESKGVPPPKAVDTSTTTESSTVVVDLTSDTSGSPLSPLKRKRKISADDKRIKKEMEIKEREEKQRKKEEERINKDLRREEERLDKERKKESERLEKERKKEAERLEKERKKEAERLEKERKKEAERIEKERKKNEERLEKLRQEELEKRKQEKTVQSFASFFLKKKSKPQEDESEQPHRSGSDYLNSFQVKSNMHLAPLVRCTTFGASRRSQLERALSQEGSDASYLKDIHSKEYVKGSFSQKWVRATGDDVLDEEDEEAVPEEVSGTVSADEVRRQSRAKLLQFHENQRPPYWGTWTKSSSHIKGRRPFSTDKHFFDYDYDSDDDWEEEEQGESLSDAEDEKEDEDEPQEDEEDDGFFVGHGVLDKDEILHEEEESGGEGGEGYNEDLEIMKQKLKAQAFEEEYKRKKPVKLKPQVLGVLWEGDETLNAFTVEQLSRILAPMSSVVLSSGDVDTIPTPLSMATTASDESSSLSDKGTSTPLKAFPEEAMFDLIRLVHANSLNKSFLSKEFAAYWDKSKRSSSFSRKAIVSKIGEIAVYKKVTDLNRRAWIVKEELLAKYVPKESPLEIPNTSWRYSLEQPNDINFKSSAPSTPDVPVSLSSSSSVAAVCTPKSLITNFVKVLTPEEREKQRLKRRVSLISLDKSPPTKKPPSTTPS